MELPEDFADAIQLLEDSAVHKASIARILSWDGLRPGQRTAALVICCWALEFTVYPRADDLARVLGIEVARCEAIFADLEHPPFALTRVEPDRFERFLPTQTMEYGTPEEG